MRSPDIRNLGVGKVDLKRAEPYRRVGANGQVKFSHGGEGDCIWSNAPTGPDKFPYEPVSFCKDPYGVVHLVGVTISVAGSGGGVVPAGSVLNDAGTNPGSLVFDGDNFRAAGKKVGLPRKPRPVLGRGALRRLLGLGG